MAGAYVVMIYGSWIYNYLCNRFAQLPQVFENVMLLMHKKQLAAAPNSYVWHLCFLLVVIKNILLNNDLLFVNLFSSIIVEH
jgi:hypothetical protein